MPISQEFIDETHAGFEHVRLNGEDLASEFETFPENELKKRFNAKIASNDTTIIQDNVEEFLAIKKIEFNQDSKEYKLLLRDILKNLPAL